ncbi:histidine phosphatase family protein [Aliiroseovarius subalbicans]|uniref:histidine phosphatase family protein n=1 Tax=Aliiroseovarius subalbicans TaxID=2925840 RepID=UPI001F565AF8|nr:histidine phosphatase family protein [Aliiroseovarius subalbicans]MCI2398711.1 histidine phosphatase family protein [Aliiroseovarius subalbicans]
MPEIFVIRHGQTAWNKAGRWQGDLDSPLTPEGFAQAKSIGTRLRRMGITAASHQFYTSPIGRARKTARLILDGQGQPIEDARLREISVGDWTGMTLEDVRAASGLDAGAPFLDFYAGAPGGETFQQLGARCEAFLTGLQGPAVVVTHGITSRFLRTLAMGWGLDRLTDLPGGQGVIHHVHNRQHAEIVPEPS